MFYSRDSAVNPWHWGGSAAQRIANRGGVSGGGHDGVGGRHDTRRKTGRPPKRGDRHSLDDDADDDDDDDVVFPPLSSNQGHTDLAPGKAKMLPREQSQVRCQSVVGDVFYCRSRNSRMPSMEPRNKAAIRPIAERAPVLNSALKSATSQASLTSTVSSGSKESTATAVPTVTFSGES